MQTFLPILTPIHLHKKGRIFGNIQQMTECLAILLRNQKKASFILPKIAVGAFFALRMKISDFICDPSLIVTLKHPGFVGAFFM
jgi:hypothetical protein